MTYYPHLPDDLELPRTLSYLLMFFLGKLLGNGYGAVWCDGNTLFCITWISDLCFPYHVCRLTE